MNKREPGLTTYRQKRQRLYQAGIHLLELDLLRRGTRPFAHPQLPDVAYAIALTRTHAGVMDVWPLQLSEHSPILPVPLKSPDLDVSLDLPSAIAPLYDEAGYDLSINCTEAPPPALSESEQESVGGLGA
ncbi:DUF4058 family protein [Acaryochloris sp. IP29b_bin.137]|uniref:DUF4058 family protein n=1 Tax=Acaryochloris sp. IP29b_bin.137 TaxID=2969217 RepID=UPI00262789CA|nr:DUF4058 family protein [Acaryochloris sp. IP29b_bin.137]